MLASVGEPVHFCAVPAPAPACQKFWLWVRPFFPYKKEKFNNFHGFKKFSCFLKIIKKFFKVNSNKIVSFKVHFKF
jgi:hypothetical protein